MKKLISLLLSLALCLCVFSGCDTASNPPSGSSSSAPEASDVSAPEASSEESQPDESQPDTPDESQAEAPDDEPAAAPSFTVDAADAFEGAYCFTAAEGGTYTFSCANAEEYSEDTWTVIVLEEEFDDAIRYLPQAMSGDPAPDGFMLTVSDGSDLSAPIEEGNYVYCISSLNAWTVGEPVENVSSLTITFEAP